MSKRFLISFLALSFALVFLYAGCSDDSATPLTPGGTTADTTAISMVDITEIISAVAPPTFTAPTAAPALDSFAIWTSGDYPLLEKVFGDDDPQALYRNITDFEFNMEMLQTLLLQDENGAVITGTFYDTVTVSIEGSDMEMYVTTEVTTLSAATTIPTAFQGILGTSHDLDYLVEIAVEQMPNGIMNIGLKIDSAEQTMLVYESGMGGGEGSTESSLRLATLDLADSTFEFNGVLFSDDGQGQFSVSYIMTSEADGGFAYRMSWFSDEIPAPDYTLLGCIIGGGNKDTEFALKYRQYTPANDASIDSEWSFDEVFGPNYTNGTGLITDYASYVNEELIISYSLVPQAEFGSPWSE